MASPDIDQGLLSQLNDTAQSAPSTGGGDIDTGLLSQLNATTSGDEKAHASGKAAAKPVAPAPQTQFQKASAPSAPNEPELSWGEATHDALKNALPSAEGALKSVATGIGGLFTGDTEKALGNVATGLYSKAQGALGVQQDAAQKAKTEALVNALGNHYATVYGSPKGFKKALATDPASIAMDASVPLTLGGDALADAAGVTGRIASTASKVGSYMDPVQLALKVAKATTVGAKVAGKNIPGIASIIPVAQSLSTGKSIDALTKAAQVETSGNPVLQHAFQSHLNGSAPPTEIVDAAQGALDQIAKKRGADYVQNMTKITGGNLPPISWAPVNSALSDARSAVRITDPTTGVSSVINEGADNALDDIQKKIDFYQAQPTGSVFGNLTGFDALKRSIGDIRNTYKNDPVAYQKATQMYNSVLGAIKDQHSDYSDAMKDYGDASDQLNQIRGTFGLKNGANDEMVLRRLLNTKTSGNKQSLLAQLSEHDPRIPYMLAGHELNPVLPGGLRQALNFAAAPVSFGVNPLLAAGQAAAASPRLMGSLNNLAGKGANLAGKALAPIPEKTAYYTGRADDESTSPSSTPTPDMDTAKKAVASVESSGMGGYSAVGPTIVHNGIRDRAIGKYQVMASNVPKWTKQVLGKPMTPEQFRADPDAQEKVFESVFGGYMQKTGNMRDALSMWHSGVPLAQAIAEKRRDVNMSTPEYVRQAGFARGGAPKATHEQLVERLMKLAKAAKKGETASTEPLLKVPDDTVAKALEIAQAAI